MSELVGPTTAHEDLPAEDSIIVESDPYLVPSRGQPKPLKDPVEVVDDANVGAVHIDLGFT